MEHDKDPIRKTSRVARHRKKVATGGGKRVEVTVPYRNAPLVDAIAGALRAGGEALSRVAPARVIRP